MRSRTDETRRIDRALEALARVGDRLRREGGWVLPASGRTEMAYFDDRPLAGTRRSRPRKLPDACARLSAAGRGGVVRRAGADEAHAGAPTMLGNPAEWALRLCPQAQPGQVVLVRIGAAATARALRHPGVGRARAARLGRSVPVRELGAMLADAGVAQAVGVSADDDAAAPARADPHVTQSVAVPDVTAPRNAWLEVAQGSGRGWRSGGGGRTGGDRPFQRC